MARIKSRSAGFLLLTAILILFAIWWFWGWNQSKSQNIVISSGDQLWVLAVRPEIPSLVQVEIPPNLIVPVGEGRWQARALWELSQLKNEPSLVEAVGWELLQVPIDNLVRVSSWRGRETSIFSPLKDCRLDSLKNCRNLLESIRLIQYTRSLHQGEIKSVDLGQLTASREVVDPGGTEIIEINREILSLRVKDWFQINKLSQEQLSVAVINATGTPGFGGRLASQLENSGVRVVSVENRKDVAGILVREPSNLRSQTVAKISKWYGIKAAVGDFDERADVLIVYNLPS